jgi:hypothetical protein
MSPLVSFRDARPVLKIRLPCESFGCTNSKSFDGVIAVPKGFLFGMDERRPTGQMIREEQTDHGADNLILYIWGDDHIRSLLRCRHAIIYKRWSHRGGTMFHANFWAHLEMNLATGKFLEKENPLDTPAALYRDDRTAVHGR